MTIHSPMVKKHPFGSGWAIERFHVVYGRQKHLGCDCFHWDEKGHGRGGNGVVVVIETA